MKQRCLKVKKNIKKILLTPSTLLTFTKTQKPQLQLLINYRKIYFSEFKHDAVT